MKCPYCNAEMTKGYIYGDRYTLKWLPEKKNLLFGIWAKDSIKLGYGGFFATRAKVEATMCQSCKKFLIDMNESYDK